MPHHQDPRQWEDEVRALQAGDLRRAPPERPILFAGSSSIRFWRLRKFFPDHHPQLLNRGFGGSGLPDLHYFFDELVVRYHPRAIVLYSGENDLAHGASPASVTDHLRQILTRVTSQLPETQVLILPLKPSPFLWESWNSMQLVNQWIAEAPANNPLFSTVDTATPLLRPSGVPDPRFYMRDQLHLSQEAYQLWSDLVRPWLDSR